MTTTQINKTRAAAWRFTQATPAASTRGAATARPMGGRAHRGENRGGRSLTLVMRTVRRERNGLLPLFRKCIILPRQARDKHRRSAPNRLFAQASRPWRLAVDAVGGGGEGRTASKFFHFSLMNHCGLFRHEPRVQPSGVSALPELCALQ